MGTVDRASDQPEWVLPLIDLARCTGCGECVRRCPTQAVALVAGHATIVRPEACSYCEVCESYCPTAAIGRPFTISFAPPRRDAA